ncbi:MAG: hypothetical protein ACJAVK_002046 [Akkermansiaceae bacterium]|jgi:hypothetical protein
MMVGSTLSLRRGQRDREGEHFIALVGRLPDFINGFAHRVAFVEFQRFDDGPSDLFLGREKPNQEGQNDDDFHRREFTAIRRRWRASLPVLGSKVEKERATSSQ